MMKDHCINGHALVPGNLRAGPLKRGWRACAQCHREATRKPLGVYAKRGSERRDAFLSVRLTRSEVQRIYARAAAEARSQGRGRVVLSAFMRSRILGDGDSTR